MPGINREILKDQHKENDRLRAEVKALERSLGVLLAACRFEGHKGAPHDTLGHYDKPTCQICSVVAVIEEEARKQRKKRP
jgi:hypothetical protein